MAVGISQGLKQSQSLLLLPQIQQAIKILLLSRQELESYLIDELRNNPVLEEGETAPSENLEFGNVLDSPAKNDVQDGQELIQKEVDFLDGSTEDFRGIDELMQRFTDSQSPNEEKNKEASDSKELPGYEIIDVKKVSLFEELETQINVMRLTPFEQECALLLLQYLTDEGFLTTPLEEILKEYDCSLEDLEYALTVIQKCEPTGVGARNLQECLILQAKALPRTPKTVLKILNDCWKEFEKQDINKIAKLLNENPADVKKAFSFIKNNLDPRPARQFGGETNIPIVPDVFVFKRGDKWVVSVNEDGLPRIKISKQYTTMIDEIVAAKDKAGKCDTKTKTFLNDKIKNAKWLLHAIAERNKTVLKVAEAIVEKQVGFFEHGIEQFKPLTLRSISSIIGIHECTVSRSTSNKYLHCPRGIFELKYFFSSGVNSGGDTESTSNQTVMNWVSEYIKKETADSVLSDQDIADKLEKEKNIKIARRTVAKYRENLGILPSSKRAKQLKQ